MTDTRHETLLRAAADATSVLNTLNRTESTCKCCGRKSKENWTEHQVAQELEAIIRKLGILSQRLKRGGE